MFDGASDIRPTPREIRWFAQIDRHGPQSSSFLYEGTRDTHRCKDTALRRIQALRDAKYLREPPQQKQIEKAQFNPNVYDLTRKGREALEDEHDPEWAARPTGHWWHGFWVSATTAAIEIAAHRRGMQFIPATRILCLRGAPLAIPTPDGKVLPDQIFALKTSEGFLTYALEVDRGTEPLRSSAARKSLARSVRQYKQILGAKLYQRHYGLKSNMLLLWVFHSKKREGKFRELAQEAIGADARAVWTTSIEAGFPRFDPVTAMIGQFRDLSARHGNPLRL